MNARRMVKRAFATSRAARAAIEPVPVIAPKVPVVIPQQVVTPPPQTIRIKKPIGAFRGGITGFLLGMTVAGGLGYTYLLTEYQNASSLLLSSIEELQDSTSRIAGYVKRIEDVENSLKKVQQSGASSKDITSLRQEMHKVYNGINVEQLDLKAKVVDLEKDLAKLVRNQRTTV